MSKTPFQSHKAGEISSSVSKAVDFERIDIRCESKETLTLYTINYSKWCHLKTQLEYAPSTPPMNAQLKKCCRLHLICKNKSFLCGVTYITLLFIKTCNELAT